MTSYLRYVIPLLALLLFDTPAASADDKTDVIYMINGDRVTGEIKEMQQGQLRLSSVSMGTILIKWSDIDRIESAKYIQAEMLDGERYFGQVPASESSGVMTVSTVSGAVQELEHRNIARLDPIKMKPSFWEKLDNTLSLGVTFTKASDILQWNVAASTEYRTRAYRASLSFDTMITDNRAANSTTRRGELTADYSRYLPDRFFWFGSGSVQTNDELGIDRRFLGTIGLARYVWQKQSSEFVVGLGVAGNLETSIGDNNQTSTEKANAEGVVQANWSYFKLHSPKSNINFLFQYYPGITDSGRNRLNTNLRLRQEFVKDLFWSVNLYGSYDSRPPSGAVAKEDYGIVTSLEYEF